LDGDRAGGFILKELKSVVDIDYELRADEGIEVEELTPKRVDELLSPVVKEINEGSKPPTLKNDSDGPLAEVCKKIFSELNESLEAIALNSKEEEVFRVAISELVGKISGQSEIEYLILDGIITQRLLDAAKTAGVKYIVGHRAAKLSNSDGVLLKTFTELGIA
ncbi:MAG: DNA primase, partial [Thermoproteota archaeon]|nr:DNA primase [Thermoproteota archaeon]